MKYLKSLELDLVREELNVRQMAADEAGRELPSTDDAEPLGGQAAIVGYVDAAIHEAHAFAGARIEMSQDRRDAIEIDSERAKIAGIPRAIADACAARVNTAQSELPILRSRQEATRRDFEKFRSDNGLERDAKYPGTVLFIVILVIALFLMETFATSLSLELGTSMSISVANTALGFASGVFLWRRVVHARLVVRVLSLGLAIGHGLFAVWSNLLVIRVFEQGGAIPATDIGRASAQLISDPTLPSSVEGTVLFLLGVAVSVFAGICGFASDDPYPGYGATARRHFSAVGTYDDAVAAARGDLAALIETAKKDLEDIVWTCRSILQDHQNLIDGENRFVTDYKRTIRQIRLDGNELLREFRAINEGARSTEAPAYFADTVPFAEVSVLPSDLLGAQAKQAELRKSFETIQQECRSARAEVDRVGEDAMTAFESLSAGNSRGVSGG